MTRLSRVPPLALFPLSYALHVAEEARGGESFPVWASRLSGVAFTPEEFVVLNGVAFAVMCVAVVAASRSPWARRTLIPALGTVVAVNGTLHLVASIWSVTYSPGVISGAIVWLPLGVVDASFGGPNRAGRATLEWVRPRGGRAWSAERRGLLPLNYRMRQG
jgi:hypothetical protein